MPDERVTPTTAVFGIGVVANLTGTGVQNLRAYEKAGLVHPQRTDGGTRLYSSDDVARLQRITVLLDAGLNLAGIAMVLKLEADNERLRRQVAQQRPHPERR
jgi:DNA-binding transcriptional MerR regulator